MAIQIAEQRRRSVRAETRRAILDAAEELLVDGGPDGFSMRRLANRCGCSAPAIYHYFRDKPSLVDALLEERLRMLVKELRQVALGDDPASNVRLLCCAFADFALRNPNHYELLVMNRGPDAREPSSGEEARAILVEPLEALVRKSGLEAPDFEALRLGLWSLLHGMILLRTNHAEEPWSPDLLQRSVDALLDGWLASNPTAPPSRPGSGPGVNRLGDKT
jgi:AcrR family transcriptional regulator